MTGKKLTPEDEAAFASRRAALLDEAERIVGYHFNDRSLLELALKHPSASEHAMNTDNYERLEFLGDSILGAIIAEEIFERFPDLEEGGLTRIKVSLVSGASLSKVAEEEGLSQVIIFGESEAGTKGRGMTSALENVFEAIVAALFLDGGIEQARSWALRVLGPHIDRDIASEPESPKSSLQEHLQARHKKPVYEITGVDGPPHARQFTASVLVDGEVLGTGAGTSKKHAEAAAAAVALERLGVQ